MIYETQLKDMTLLYRGKNPSGADPRSTGFSVNKIFLPCQKKTPTIFSQTTLNDYHSEKILK